MARTLTQVQEEYDAARAAWMKAVEAQSYGVEGRSVSRQDLDVLRKQMDRLASELERISGGGIIPRGITPVG